MTTLKDTGETETIRRLTHRLRIPGDVRVGPGDDAAVVAGREDDLVLTSDPVIEGTHFTLSDSPRAVGHKAVGRVLSDIAAMGAAPAWGLVDLSAPPGTDVAFIEAVYDGAVQLAERCGLALVGGDLSRGPVLALHVFAVGRVPAGTALLRSTARAGDRICVTGMLGGASRGKHLQFEPRLREGAWLRESGLATALMDITDGLARDLARLTAASGTGARLNAAAIPVSEAAAMDDGLPPLDHALYDGEDFELLFTVTAGREQELLEAWASAFALPCTAVGALTGAAGVLEIAAADGTVSTPDPRHFRHFGETSGGGTE